MKVLALDFGRARTGVAVSDPTGTVARPLGVVEAASTEHGLARIEELVAEHDPQEIVVGLPLTMRGDRGEQAFETETFVERLAARISIPVVTFDERFTTDLAQQTPRGSAEDARAAAHLLSSYLACSNGARA